LSGLPTKNKEASRKPSEKQTKTLFSTMLMLVLEGRSAISPGVQVGQVIYTSQEEKTKAISEYYASSMGATLIPIPTFYVQILYSTSYLPSILDVPFIAKETLDSPDGFGSSFYKVVWQLEKKNHSYESPSSIPQWPNQPRQYQHIICHPPKKPDALTVGDYRPICLQNYNNKILSKILINCHKPIIDSLIILDQTGFLKGRSISKKISSMLLI
jgi:hypothetical protein